MCSSSESCLADGILRLLSPEPPPRAGQNSRGAPGSTPALGALVLVRKTAEPADGGGQPWREAGGQASLNKSPSVPSACRGPGRCAGKGLSCWRTRRGYGSSPRGSRGAAAGSAVMAEGYQAFLPSSPLCLQESLVLDRPRVRKQTKHYNSFEEDELMEFSELDSDSDERPTRSRRLNDKTRRYLRAECFRVEKNLLIFGWVLASPLRPRLFPPLLFSRDVSSVSLPSPLGSGRREGLLEKERTELSARGPLSQYALPPFYGRTVILSCVCHSTSLGIICCLVLISGLFPPRTYRNQCSRC